MDVLLVVLLALAGGLLIGAALGWRAGRRPAWRDVFDPSQDAGA